MRSVLPWPHIYATGYTHFSNTPHCHVPVQKLSVGPCHSLNVGCPSEPWIPLLHNMAPTTSSIPCRLLTSPLLYCPTQCPCTHFQCSSVPNYSAYLLPVNPNSVLQGLGTISFPSPPGFSTLHLTHSTDCHLPGSFNNYLYRELCDIINFFLWNFSHFHQWCIVFPAKM